MTKKSRAWLVFLIFINGYISLSLELLVLRNIGFWVGSSAVVTSIVMGTFLGFMSLGYFMGSSPKVSDEKIKSVLSYSFVVIAIFGFLAATFPLVTNYFGTLYQLGVSSNVIQTAIYAIIFLSVAPFLFGFNTTLLSRCLHKYNTNYTGNIMAWDTIGSVIGSLLTTLILMPFLGVNNTVILVVALAIFSAIISRPKWYVGMAGIVLIGTTAYFNSDYYQHKTYGIIVNNANSTISVQDTNGFKILNMNGLPMSVYDSRRNTSAEYIEYINQVYLYTIPRDRVHKVLVLGAGGFTAGLDDDFNEYTFVDIEHTLQEVSEKYFLNRTLSPNKHFVVADASQFLKNTPELYDVILLDVYSNSYQVPEGLITAEFMERIKSRVAPNGIIIMNVITSLTFADKYTRVFDNTFHTVFPYNTQRQVINYANPWAGDDVVNVLYIYYNRENSGRIYTIDKTPVIYDKKIITNSYFQQQNPN